MLEKLFFCNFGLNAHGRRDYTAGDCSLAALPIQGGLSACGSSTTLEARRRTWSILLLRTEVSSQILTYRREVIIGCVHPFGNHCLKDGVPFIFAMPLTCEDGHRMATAANSLCDIFP